MSDYTITQYTSDVGSLYKELYDKSKASLDAAITDGMLVDSAYGAAMTQIIQEIVRVSVQGPLQLKQAEDLQKKIDSGLYDAQKDEVVAQTQLLKDQDDELILNGTKSRDKLDVEIKLIGDQDSELLLNGTKERDYKDKQIAKVNLDTKLVQQQLDSNLFDKEAKKREEEILLIDSQIDGTNRQTRGYDEHTKIELFKSQMNAYGILLSSGATDITPDIITKSAVNDIYNNLLNGTNIAVVD